MQKIVNELIDSSIKGVDVYRWKNAKWLIFTDEVRWVLELTDEGTLWYNYKFFNDVFKYVSMTVGKEMEEYVIQWANDFFYKDCAHRSIAYPRDKGRNETPKVLKNGIKEVYDSSSTHRQMRAENLVGRIIRDVKPNLVDVLFEEQIRCYHDPTCNANNTMITDIIEGGVKEVKPNVVFHGIDKSSMSFVPCNGNTTDINIIVKSGIKNIYPDQISGDQGYNWSNEFEADKVIEYGVKL
jgi:hypothetical protein